MSLDRPNLSAAFTNKKTPVDRTSGLTGLLPASRPRPSTSPSTTAPSPNLEPAATATAVEAAPPLSPPKVKTVRSIPETKNAAVSDIVNITTNVAVYLEPDLLALVKIRRRTADLTYDGLVHAAFAETDEEQLRAAFAPAGATSDGSSMPARQRRPRGTGGIQLQLRLDTPQRAWLDDTQQRVGAPSRSALVATVLRLHLTT